MLPAPQVIPLDLGDASAAADLPLEKADNEIQGLFLTSLVSCYVAPTSCASTIYTEGGSFGGWGVWCAPGRPLPEFCRCKAYIQFRGQIWLVELRGNQQMTIERNWVLCLCWGCLGGNEG